jgi:hypothetical protein
MVRGICAASDERHSFKLPARNEGVAHAKN